MAALCNSTLTLLDDVVEKNDSAAAAAAPDIDLLHRALLMRARVYYKRRKLIWARNDVQRAIVTKPKHVYAYGLLSDIELGREQFGRAEVALRLGLLLDPNHVDLKEKLGGIRRRDSVHPDVSHHAGTDGPVRMMQRKAGLELAPPFNPLILAAMTGSIVEIRRNWNQALMRDLKNGRLWNPLMHFPVLGIQRMKPPPELREKELEGHKAVIDFLYDRGVRLDGQDYCGYTAVMHASGSLPQPELLEYLLSKGADPNVRSTFGTVALMDATMSQNVREVEILTKYKADPYIADNDDIVPIKFAENHKLVLAAYHRSLYAAAELPGRNCGRCSNGGNKRCAKCRVVRYCSKKCQMDDWMSHESRCKKFHESHKRLAIVDNKFFFSFPDISSTMVHNFLNQDRPGFEPKILEVEEGKLFDAYNDEVMEKGNLLLKIQVGLDAPIDARRGSVPEIDFNRKLMVYNESKSFRCFLDPHKLDGQELIYIIRDKGYAGKGYFWAFMESGQQQLTVITDPVHRAQPR